MAANILAGRWGQCRDPAGGASQRDPDGSKYFKLNISFCFYLEGGEVGNLETGSLELEVLEPDLLE